MVKCSGEGCGWTGPRSELDAHETTCVAAVVCKIRKLVQPEIDELQENHRKLQEEHRKLQEENRELQRKMQEQRQDIFYVAAAEGRARNVEKSIRDGNVDIDFVDEDTGLTPLMIASLEGHAHVVRLLLGNGANRFATSECGHGAIHFACGSHEHGHAAVVRTLLEDDIDLANERDNSRRRRSPLAIASVAGYDDIVKMLLDFGAEMNAVDTDGASSLYLACERGNAPVAKILLEKNADTELRPYRKSKSPLMIASQLGYVDIVRKLLTYGARINATSKTGWSSLLSACLHGHAEVVEALLEAKDVDVNLCKRDSGYTPLMIASEEGHDDIVRKLLEFNAENVVEVNATDKKGVSSLYLASRGGHAAVVEMLLSKGADPNLGTRRGLAAAADRDDETIVRSLLVAGARDDDEDEDMSLAAKSLISRVKREIDGFK